MDALQEIARLQELLAAKDQLLACKEGTGRPTEELRQYKGSDHPDDNIKRRRLYHSSSLEGASPLDRDEVLDQILSYIGGGEHLYIAGVSRRWRGRYLRFCVLSCTRKYHEKLVTKHGSTLMTERRLKLALAAGLSVEGWTWSKPSRADWICKHSVEPERVMTLLRLHGVPWHEALCNAAAVQAKLPLLQWLRSSSCPWVEEHMLVNASVGGSVAMLEWLASVTEPWPEDALAEMINTAASCNKLAAVKWLRARGAQWPDSFTSQYIDAEYVAAKQCWGLAAVQWAVAAGSGWLNWKCEDFNDDKYQRICDKRQAIALLKWAHANGCPCTCKQQQQ
jgi:hypothetical protein